MARHPGDSATETARAWCGDPEVDATRRDALEHPTTPQTFWDRAVAVWAWMVVLQRLGADLDPFLPLLDRIEDPRYENDPEPACRAVDEAFEVLARIQADAGPPRAVSVEPGDAPPPPADAEPWPVYAGNARHTASTDDAGPTGGRVAWRFATGLAWYARPTVEGGRVYATSPGMRTRMWCLDLETGGAVWKTTRTRTGRPNPHSHVLPQSYTTPAAASTPHVVGGELVVAEMGAQGKSAGLRGLVWIDRQTGAVTRHADIGYADYRTGYARLGGHGRYVVHPNAAQRLEPNPPQCIGHNRLLCRRADDGESVWDFPCGLTFADPVLDEQRAYVGTRDGAVFALNLEGGSSADHFGFSDERRVAWQFNAGGAVNAAVGLGDGMVVFGANDGMVYAVDRQTGVERWRVAVEEPEPRAFQQFSPPALAERRVYVGSARRRLYCLDAATGEALWSAEMPDWVRSRPVLAGGRVVAAMLDGTVHAFDAQTGEPAWSSALDRFPVFADLVHADGRLLATDARLRLWCLDASTGVVRWQHHLLQHAEVHGQAVQSDELACGGFHQSKPTAAAGKVFVGSPCRFLFAVDAATGQERWRFEMGGAISGAPAYASGDDAGGSGRPLVLVGQQGGEDDFYGLDAETGLPVWTQTLGWVWSSANVADGRAFVPCVDGHLACVDVRSGHVRWRYRTGRGAYPEPPVADGRVFFGSWDHFVYAFEAATGRLLWKFHTGGTPDSGAPIAHGGKLYVPMGGRRLCCLDAATGRVIWEVRPEQGCMNASPALWGGRLFVSTSVRTGAIPPASAIRCLDAADGRELWSHPGGGITGPSVAGGKVYFGSTSGRGFTCVDAEGRGDGATTEHWQAAMGDRVYESVPAIYGGRAYVLSEDGYLYAFE